jgi:hypothetical protein
VRITAATAERLPLYPVGVSVEQGSLKMKLSTYAFAAAIVATIITPTFASAQDVRVRIGEDHGMSRDYDRGYRGPRAEYRRDHGWHRGWRNRDRVVVIKQRRHRWD